MHRIGVVFVAGDGTGGGGEGVFGGGRLGRKLGFGEEGGEVLVGLVQGGVDLKEVGWVSGGVLELFGHVCRLL